VAAQSRTWVLTAWILGSRVRIVPILVYLCCVVPCRHKPCDGLITRPRSPAEYLNWLTSSEVTLNWNRPQGPIRKNWWWWWWRLLSSVSLITFLNRFEPVTEAFAALNRWIKHNGNVRLLSKLNRTRNFISNGSNTRF
jgi:hypothetical protein